MPFLYLFFLIGAGILAMVTLLWLISLRLKNASIIDVFWGIIFILIAWLAFALTPQGYLPRKQLLCMLVSIWGLRLALHIAIRNWGGPEDFRYARWRTENGKKWWWISFFQVFLLQGFLIWIISAPLIAAQTSGFPAILTPLDWLGSLVWIIGFVIEAIGDFQLILFKKNFSQPGQVADQRLMENYASPKLLW